MVGVNIFECVNLQKVVIFDENMRQNDASQEEFRTILNHIADGGYTKEKDWTALEKRSLSALSEEEINNMNFCNFFWGFQCTVDSVVDPHRIWFGDAMNDVIITTSKFKVLEA